MRVCRLGTPPSVTEPVLLDLDVDFMMIPRVNRDALEEHCASPWIRPAELLDTLAARGIHGDLVTIAYSVNGGYTPLKWKHLGDELAARLRGEPFDPPATLDYDTPYVNLAFPLLFHGDLAGAERAFNEVLQLDAENAWARLGLGLLDVERKRPEAAEQRLRDALQRNPRMLDGWRALADILRASGRYEEALAAYDRSIALAFRGLQPLASIPQDARH